jgi:iron complex transport system substrate-binding protein
MQSRKIVEILSLFSMLALLVSCHQEKAKPWIGSYFDENAPDNLSSKVKYAVGFDLYEWNGIRKLVVYHPESKGEIIGDYYLASAEITQGFRDTLSMVTLPLNKLAVFSATQLNAFQKLGKLDLVKGISEASYIINEEVRHKIENGEMVELAGSGHYFVEKTIRVNPTLIFHSPYKITETHALDVTGIPLIPFYDYHETDPLGRAEWIKFTAAFTGDIPLANEIFDEMEVAYLKYKGLTQNIETRPTVFSDKYFNGQWFVPGGQSYFARILEDAGADYLWKDDPHAASFPLDYEAVFSKAHDADYWRIIGSYGDDASYEGLLAENELYEYFSAFANRKVIYCNARKSAYFENSPLEPQIILADLIKIFHPELMSDHEARYYELLP